MSHTGGTGLLYRAVLAGGMLISGTINTVAKKFQNESCAIGLEGDSHQFTHPWFQTLIMFIGEALCLLGFLAIRFHRRRQQQKRAATTTDQEDLRVNSSRLYEERTPLLLGAGSSSEVASVTVIDEQQKALDEKAPVKEDAYLKHGVFQPLFILPMLCDLCGTTLSGIGLLFISASVWQMLRGSVIIFSGILSVIFLKRKLGVQHWLGMFVTFCGLVLVGTSSLLAGSEGVVEPVCGGAIVGGSDEKDHDDKMAAVGIILVLAAQLASAVQYIIEEKFLKGRNFVPIHVVGMEGAFGAFTMLFFVMPIVYFIPGNNYGSVDNLDDALVQIWNNGVLMFCVLLYIFSIAFYNFFGLSVAKSLSTVHRTLIDACRTLLVWGVDLLLYYAFKLYIYGEAWNEWSWLEVLGFVVLLLGTFVYNSVIRIPFIKYPQKGAAAAVDSSEQPTAAGASGIGRQSDEEAFFVDPDTDDEVDAPLSHPISFSVPQVDDAAELDDDAWPMLAVSAPRDDE